MLPFGPPGQDFLDDALRLLKEWFGDAREIRRTLCISDAEHAALTERIKVASDAFQLRPEVRRADGNTQIRVRPADGGPLNAGAVALAARIEAAYQAVTGR
jgi:4a-hydroxytetrahydrobiopterin dehydratase